MHKQRKALTSFIALLLCFLTLFSSALAYTEQNAQQGFPKPPSSNGGAVNSGIPDTFHNKQVIEGYRFTCWRSEDYEKYSEKYRDNPAVLQALLSAHDEPGRQLGHPINILVNHGRTDNANSYNQTGVKAPRMFTNVEQTETLNKIALAHTEIKSDNELGLNKLTHGTATDLCTLHFSGAVSVWGDGKLTKVDKSSTFRFTSPIYQNMDKGVDPSKREENDVINSKFNGVDTTNPLVIYSGYQTKNDAATKYINTGAPNGQANNLYTYIYGYQYSDENGTGYFLDGWDESVNYLTISDIDYEDAVPGDGKNDVLPFNCLPYNVIGPDDSWTNRNAALIATLCGLTPRYGMSKIETFPDDSPVTNTDFCMYDYIIVEPIYTVYYYNHRYFVTASDIGILHAQSQAEAFGSSAQCWYKTYGSGFTWQPNATLFNACFGTYIYADDNYFGVDGVLNATYGSEAAGNKYQAFTQYKTSDAGYYGFDIGAVQAAVDKNAIKPGDEGYYPEAQKSINPLTNGYVFTNNKGGTYFIGHRNVTKEDIVWYGTTGNIYGIFLAPYVSVESMIGSGVWMAGQNTEPTYEVVYHSNPNNGAMSGEAVTYTQAIDANATKLTFAQYESLSKHPVGKIGTGYWTYDDGPSGAGITDNSISSIPLATNSTSKGVGKVQANSEINGNTQIMDWFHKYGTYTGNKYTVHLYAAWNTKALVTTLDRTFNDNVQSLVAASNSNQLYGDTADEADVPTSIALVQVTGTSISTNSVNIVPLKRDGAVWYPETYNQGTNVTTYIVYSYVPGEVIDNSDKSNIISMLNASNPATVAGLQFYTANNARIKWDMSSTTNNFFYFDLYSFTIKGFSQTFDITVQNTPVGTTKDKNDTTHTNVAFYNDIANEVALTLVRGTTVSYVSKANSGLGYAAGDIGDILDYTNGNNAWIKEASNVAPQDIVLDAVATETTFGPIEFLGKRHHELNVSTGYTLEIRPALNGTSGLPFENYFVKIFTNGQEISYGPGDYDADGLVTQVLLEGIECQVYVSATDASGSENMYWAATVRTNETDWETRAGKPGKYKTLNINYFTVTADYKTQSGGNHSGVAGKLIFRDKASGDSISEYDSVYQPGTSTDSVCNATVRYYRTKGIAFSSATSRNYRYNSEVMDAEITRTVNSNWYIHTATYNGSTVSETAVKEGYRVSKTVTDAVQTYSYVFRPYHVLMFTLDGELVSYNKVLSSIPSGYSEYPSGGLTHLRAPYNTSATIPSIVNASNKNGADTVTVTHNVDATQTTVFNYYTVVVDADTGYSNKYIASSGGTNMGTTAYVLKTHDVGYDYTSCVTGSPSMSYSSTTNTKTYKTVGVLKSNAKFSALNVMPREDSPWIYPNGKITPASGLTTTGATLTATFRGCDIPKTTTASNEIESATTFFWESQLEMIEDFTFVFRINDVPYDTLPETVNQSISLGGRYTLTFSRDSNQRVIAKGKAPVGSFELYLNGQGTGVTYNIAHGGVYYVDFYTLRVAAGEGVNSVSINSYDNGNAWNGTLPYIAPGSNRVYDTIAIFPDSIDSGDAFKNVSISATVLGGNTFNKWETKWPTSNVSITYASTTAANTTVNVDNINHATVVQAMANSKSSPIVIPAYPEHNVLYYGVRLRTFLNGSIVNPWNDIAVWLYPTEDTTQKNALSGTPTAGTFAWAVCMDEYSKQTTAQQSSGAAYGTKNNDPYGGKKATGYFAPAAELQHTSGIKVETHYHSANNVYIANQYINIDAFYYTQTFQTQVNGVNTQPWANAPVKYTLHYKDFLFDSADKGVFSVVNVNTAGIAQTAVIHGMQIGVNGMPYNGGTAYQNVYKYTDAENTVTRAKTYFIPYYSVTMQASCNGVPPLDGIELKFMGSVDLSTAGSKINVMPGQYQISATQQTIAKWHYSHTFYNWSIGLNEIFYLEYKDSGDGSNPFPTLTYTGERRQSTSSIANLGTQSTTVTVSDETNLVAEFGCAAPPEDPELPPVDTTERFSLLINAIVQDGKTGEILPNNVLTVDKTVNGSTVAAVFGFPYPGIAKDSPASLNATLQYEPVYYPTNISIKVNLDGTASNNHTVYYSTIKTWPELNEILVAASSMNESAKAALFAQKGIVEMQCTGNGIYTGTVPYSDKEYYLFVDGMVQNNTIKNDKITTYEFGKYGNTSVIWDGSSTSNSSSVSFTMDDDKSYTVYARRVTNGNTPSTSTQTVNLYTVSIHTNTDYQPVMPFAGSTNVKITTNGVEKTVNINTTTYSFVVSSGTTLQLVPQVNILGTYMPNAMYNGTINGKQTFLLSYNTVTVQGDEGLTTTLNDAATAKGVFLAHYAIGNGALQSANTKVDINAFGAGLTTQTIHQNQSTITVTTLAGQKLALVAQDVNFDGFNKYLIQGDGKYYAYIVTQATYNQYKDSFSTALPNQTESHYVALSTDPTIPGNLTATLNAVVLRQGYTYALHANFDTKAVRITAAAGTKFEAGSQSNVYTFSTIPDGTYLIYMNDNLLVTQASHIASVSGTAVKKDNNTIIVDSTKNSTAQSGTTFKQWNYYYTPGTAHGTYVSAGSQSATTAYTKAELTSQLVTGTQVYHAVRTGGNTDTTMEDNGAVVLKDLVGYKVITYVDGKIAMPFDTPVTFNGTIVDLGTSGQSATIYAMDTPMIGAKANNHTGYVLLFSNGTVTFPTQYISVHSTIKLIDATTNQPIAGQEVAVNPGATSVTFTNVPAGQYKLMVNNILQEQVFQHFTYSAANSSAPIVYDSANRVFRVYYYSVTYSVNGAEYGQISSSTNCSTENILGPVVVAKGTTVQVGNTLNVGSHDRIASTLALPGMEVKFNGWSKTVNGSAATVTDPITNTSHFTANFSAEEKTYTVTLYNKSSKWTLKYLNVNNIKVNGNPLTSRSTYAIKSTSILGGFTSSVVGNAPNTVMDEYKYGQKATLNAFLAEPQIHGAETDGITTTITIKLTGYTSEQAHTVQLADPSTDTVVYTANAAAGSKKATFTGVAPGYYQLKIDNIPYSTQFSYYTHEAACKVEGTTEGVLIRPSYSTSSAGGGIIYVAPQYKVRVPYVSSWQQVTVDGNVSSFSTLPEKYRPSITYSYICDECNHTWTTGPYADNTARATKCPSCPSTRMRMTSSKLVTPAIDDNLEWEVYNSYSTQAYNPSAIVLSVEMAYPVHIQGVLDNSNKLPFSGAQVRLMYTVNGGTSYTALTQTLDSTGKTTFYVPMGATYYIEGASASKGSTGTFVFTGFSAEQKQHATSTFTYTNGYINGAMLTGGAERTLYVRYWTVTAKAGTGIRDVNVTHTTGGTYTDGACTCSASNTYGANCTCGKNDATISTVWQNGQTASVNAYVGHGTLPVYIYMTKNNALYNPSTLEVYLSTSKTTLDKNKAYKLTYDSSTGCYKHAAVPGVEGGTTYYVWANGKSLSTTFEYTHVEVTVDPYKTPVKWSGNAVYRNATTALTSTNRSLSSAQYVMSFYVDRTITETATATANAAVYKYDYANLHPTSSSDPEYDPNDPDFNDNRPQNTVYYYTLTLSYDQGITSTAGAGTYLEMDKPSIDAAVKAVQNNNLGRTPITVTLYLDGQLWGGQTVTIGGYPTTEISTGVYKTTRNFGDGTYAVVVTQKNCTLLDSGKTMGQITVDSTRTYTWKTWSDGHVTCSKCGVVGDCCITTKCSTDKWCSNCHTVADSNNALSCACASCTHTYTTCPFSGTAHGGACKDNLQSAVTTKANSILMKHDSTLRAITSYKDTFTFTGNTTINFYTLRLDGDAGIKSITINGTTYTPGTAITTHGATSNLGTGFVNDLPTRVATSTKSTTTHVKSVIVKTGRNTTISAAIKDAVTNHAEATTDAAIQLTINGKPFTGRTVTIGGFTATDADNDGIYVTSGAKFKGGQTVDVVVDGRKTGTLTITSTRTYSWLAWSEPWNDAHKCPYHNNAVHTCGDCDALLNSATTANSNQVNGQNRFAHLVARTQFTDSFTFLVKNNNGDKDPVITDLYTLDINQYLNNSLTDDLPIKFVNNTSGVTLYIIPDGQTYYVYDANGNKLSNTPLVYSIADGKVSLALHDGDKYTISVLDEIEDKNQDDKIDINDITPASLKNYTYTQHSTGTINHTSATVNIYHYTLTVNIYNDGTLGMPGGKSNNGSTSTFEAPVWLDDVTNNTLHDTAPNYAGTTADSVGDTAMNSVKDAKTVKAYLSGQPYDVKAKAYDTDSNASGTLTNVESGSITAAKTVNVYYWSLTVDHYGGFTNVKINVPGDHVVATTPTGATSNAIAKAWFLNNTAVSATATLAKNNTWYQWTGNTSTASGAASQTQTYNITAKTVISAHAKTFYTVRHYLHNKHLNWQNVYEKTFAGFEINNRTWVNTTVTGEPNKYVNFDAYLTNYYADSTAAHATLRDNWAWGTPNTIIRIAIAADQSGGISYVDYFYTRNGSVNKPTPTTPGTTGPGDGTDTDYTTHPDPGVNDDINTTTNSAPKEYVKITYIEKNPSTGATLNSTTPPAVLAGTDITLIDPTKTPAGYEFVGWALGEDGSGMIGANDDHYILSKDTTVYAVYVIKLDLGITANDIYGTIKTNSKFMTSATVVNHTNLSVVPGNHIQAKLRIRVNGTLMSEADTNKIVSYFSHSCTCGNATTCKNQNSCHDIIVPGNGTQLIWATVDTAGWNKNSTYELEWYLVFPSLYEDKVSANNQSKLNGFKPDTQAVVANTARPDFSTTEPSKPSTVSPYDSSNTKFSWQYWMWNASTSQFGHQTSSGWSTNPMSDADMMSITIILKPENESGLRTYELGAFNIHNYTTRSGYGLSLHSIFNDCTLGNKFSNITANSTTGNLEAVMTFPEFNYADKNSYDATRGALNQYYTVLQVIGSGKTRSLMFQQYTDLKTEDSNDQFAHYTPMWLPDGKYVPMTYVSGLWTPLGEMRATVQQGQFGTDTSKMNTFGIYTNMITIKGSLYDDLYNNP